MGANDLLNWMTLSIAAIVSIGAFLLASTWVGGVAAFVLMIFCFLPLSVFLARKITGRDLMTELGFRSRA